MTNKLADAIHDKYLQCGEILPASDIARIIRDIEFWDNVEFDAKTILTATREAGERFVDSMIDNEPDESQRPKWEAMRPSVVRQKQIEKILA